MNLSITFTGETEKNLAAVAAQCGKDVGSYVHDVIEEKVREATRITHVPNATMTLDEILAPIRADFKNSGMSEDELDALVEEERKAIWREKQAVKK